MSRTRLFIVWAGLIIAVITFYIILYGYGSFGF